MSAVSDSAAGQHGFRKTLVSPLWETRYTRISGDALDDRTDYEFSIALPRADPDRFHEEARDVVAGALRINVRREVRDVDAWVLSKNKSIPASSRTCRARPPEGGAPSTQTDADTKTCCR